MHVLSSRSLIGVRVSALGLLAAYEVRRGGGGGVLLEKLGGGMRPASEKPYLINDQNLRISLPYL